MQDRCVKLRGSGAIQYGWISDATRRGHFTPTYSDAGDFLRSVAGHYRADLWQQSKWYCEVWVELRYIAGVILNDCKEFAESLYPAAGFSSITLAYEAARDINAPGSYEPVQIFYIGGYDQASVLIDVAIERELRLHLNPSIYRVFDRLGITIKQIAEYDLPSKPRKIGDRRSIHVKSTVEAEAMPVQEVRFILRNAIESLLREDALRVTKVYETEERAHLEGMARLLPGMGGIVNSRAGMLRERRRLDLQAIVDISRVLLGVPPAGNCDRSLRACVMVQQGGSLHFERQG